MSRKLGQMLLNAKRNGVNQGRQFQGAIYLLALDNILSDYLNEEDMSKVLIGVEEESNRIAREVLDSVPSDDIEEMSMRIVYYVEQIRKKRGMPRYEDQT